LWLVALCEGEGGEAVAFSPVKSRIRSCSSFVVFCKSERSFTFGSLIGLGGGGMAIALGILGRGVDPWGEPSPIPEDGTPIPRGLGVLKGDERCV
jgi:hypothetical protein